MAEQRTRATVDISGLEEFIDNYRIDDLAWREMSQAQRIRVILFEHQQLLEQQKGKKSA